MNIALGLLIEVVAFGAAAYLVISLRPRLPQRTTDLLLASVGCVMGVGALLFQEDVAVSTGVLAPLFAGFLLVAHVRVLDATGITLPAWVKIPALGRRGAYASAPTGTEEVEEPVQQPNATTEPEPASGFDPDPLPGEEELLAPPLPPAMPEPAWPSTVVRPPVQTRLPRRGVRRTRVEVRRVGPFSVLKFSLIFYFCVFLVIYLALAIIWMILSASGVIDSLEALLGSIFPPASPTGEISTRGAPPIEIDSGSLFTWLFVAGCIGVAIWSVINVFIAVMYNLISDIVGGIEVTLADRRER
jgi:Transmembrane domain of unknown function (DUF3566)